MKHAPCLLAMSFGIATAEESSRKVCVLGLDAQHPSVLFALETSVWPMPPPANFGGLRFAFSLQSDPNHMRGRKSTRSAWASRRQLAPVGRINSIRHSHA